MPLIQLPRSVLPIYLTTFVDMLGYTLLIPLLPAIAKVYGAHDWLVGMLLSIPAAFATAAAPVWGKLSDRMGRKTVLLTAQAFTLTGYLVLASARSLSGIFISRLVTGIGAGSIGTAQSYIADVTEPHERNRAYAIFGAVFGASFIIGPVAAGLLQHAGLQFPFYVAAALEALNIGLTIWLLPRFTRTQRRTTSIEHSINAALQPQIRRVLVRQFLFVFAVVYLLADFALFLDHQLHLQLATVSWLLASAGIVGAIAMIFGVTPLTRRFGDRWVAQLGLLLLFIAYCLIYFVRDVWWFAAVLLLWASGAALVEPTLMALLSRRAPESERGAVMGVSDAVASAALILAPAVGTAIVGANARLIGALPAIAVAAAWFTGRAPKARS
ncbi:MAG: MFS transporter [Candidatus Eremiobacteraeota bacterium]|nr:MFS transporter [Candidatus Eremiobacteraeota bacterium]